MASNAAKPIAKLIRSRDLLLLPCEGLVTAVDSNRLGMPEPSAAAICPAVEKRSSALGARALMTTCSSRCGISGRTVRSEVIGSDSRFAMIACALEPV
jgi:hypothetical protein